MTMAAGRKSTAPKRGVTNARRGRPPIKSARPKTTASARPKTANQKAAKKAARGRTQSRRASSSHRTPPKMDAVLAAQLETMAQEFGEIRAELKDLRGLVEALTSMVEGLMATQRLQAPKPEQEVTSEEHQGRVEDVGRPDVADDQDILEMAESLPPAL
jgi:uncharacterized membrane protein YccC